MTFKDLKANYILHVFDRKNITYKEGKVVSVSLPRFENKIGQTPCSVVDVSLDIDGKTTTYVFPENSSKAYSGDLTFSIDKNDIVADIKAIKNSSEQIISDVDKYKDTVSKCSTLLGELDTEYKEKQQLESRLGNIETMMSSIMEKLNKSVSQ